MVDRIGERTAGQGIYFQVEVDSGAADGNMDSAKIVLPRIRAKGTTFALSAAKADTLSGVTATAAEINRLIGVTVSAQQLNYLSGVTASIQAQLAASGGGTSLKGISGGYLTLESGVYGSTSDQSDKTTLYFGPDPTSQSPGQIDLWNGSASVRYTFSETLMSVTALTADTNYDIWAYDSGGSVALASTAWTNGTTRATALATIADGYYVKSGDTGKRYVGTIRTVNNSGTKVTDSSARRFVYNLYNQKPKNLRAADPTDSWTYSSNPLRAANNNTTDGEGRVSLVCGLSCFIEAMAINTQQYSASQSTVYAPGIGLDSVTVSASNSLAGFGSTAFANARMSLTCNVLQYLSPGYHYVQQLEGGNGLSFYTYYGDFGTGASGSLPLQTGLQVKVSM